MHLEKIYPRDVIALIVLLGIGFLIYKGFNSWLQGIGLVIITYYFSKRIYEENNRK